MENMFPIQLSVKLQEHRNSHPINGKSLFDVHLMSKAISRETIIENYFFVAMLIDFLRKVLLLSTKCSFKVLMFVL